MEQIASQPLNDLPVRPTPSQPTTPQPRHRETLIGITTLIAQRLAFGALLLVTIAFLSHLGLSMAQGTAFQPALAQAASKTWPTWAGWPAATWAYPQRAASPCASSPSLRWSPPRSPEAWGYWQPPC